jgi:PAS domain S-box-containing protein
MMNHPTPTGKWTERSSAAPSDLSDTAGMFRLLFERSADAMTLQDPLTGRFLDVNEAAVRLTGAPDKAALLGSDPLRISPELQSDGSLSAEKVKAVIQIAVDRGSHRFEWLINRFDGTQLPVEMVLTLIRGGAEPLLLSVSRDITERKHTENELRSHQQLLVSVTDNISEAIYRTGPNHELIFANRAYLRMSGFHSLEEMRHLPREKLYAHPEDRARLLDLLERQGSFRNEEIQYVRHDGKPWWGLTNSIAVRDEYSGQVLYHVGSVADITERKHAEDEIRKLNASLEQRIVARTAELTASEARLRTILEHAPEAIVVFDGDTGKFLSGNQHALNLYGCTAEELVQIGPADVSAEFQPDGRASAEAARDWIDQAIVGQTPIFEWLHRHRSGRIIPTEVRLVRLPSKDRTLLRASIIDNTEHKRTEENLRRRSEQIQKHRDVLLRLARSDKSDFNQALGRITATAAETMDIARVSYWSLQENDAALVCELLHCGTANAAAESFKGTRLSATDAPAYFTALATKRPINAGDVATHPATAGLLEGYLKPLGITSLLDVPVWVRGEVVGVICHEHIGPAREWSPEEIDFASSLAAMVSLALEESHRARSEQLLRESEGKFRALFEASSQGVMLHDEHQYLEVNPAIVRILGYDSAAELIGLHPSKTSPPVQPTGESTAELAQKYIAECLSKGHVRFEWIARRKNGEDIPVEVILTRIQWGGKQIIQAAVNDISQRKAAEAELLKALAREKELGQLKSNFVSMVSHEFRTPLGVIMSSAEILDNYLDQLDPEDRREQLLSIRKNTRRMADLMEEVLVLGMVEAGRLNFQPAPLDLLSFCRRLGDELQSATNNKCPIQIAAPREAATAFADERLLQHIFTNLLSNAVKYSPAGSPVEFDLERDGAHAICRVRDHGMGIPEADLEQLFSAFFRGRNAGQVSGTGLGLTIVKRCVELHRGKIKVESAVGRGTTVIVKLPLFAINSLEAK